MMMLMMLLLLMVVVVMVNSRNSGYSLSGRAYLIKLVFIWLARELAASRSLILAVLLTKFLSRLIEPPARSGPRAGAAQRRYIIAYMRGQK